MTGPANGSELRLGFLTAIELPEKGFVAGLLVTNRFSRPLEFQCTTPVKPNRTQELLYGPTLRPFILGELLSRPLIEKVSVKPDLIVTDRPEMLNLREHVRVPVVQIDSTESHAPSALPTASGPDAGAADVPAPPSGVPGSVRDASAGGPLADGPCDGETALKAAASERTDPPLSAGRYRLRVDPAHPQDREALERFRPSLPEQLDLREPIQRVREALREASAAMGGTGR